MLRKKLVKAGIEVKAFGKFKTVKIKIEKEQWELLKQAAKKKGMDENEYAASLVLKNLGGGGDAKSKTEDIGSVGELLRKFKVFQPSGSFKGIKHFFKNYDDIITMRVKGAKGDTIANALFATLRAYGEANPSDSKMIKAFLTAINSAMQGNTEKKI